MKLYRVSGRAPGLTLIGVTLLSVAAAQASTTLRIASYNIDADTTTGNTGSLMNAGSLETVLEGMSSVTLNGDKAQKLDVLALEEVSASTNGATTPSTAMLQTIVDNLNTKYGAGVYAFDSTADPNTGSTGGGPSALIYNTTTVSLTNATSLGTASGSGAARAPMQYTLQPLGYGTAAQFYLDVSHMKSGTASEDSTNPTRRNVEATTLATNEMSTLPANAHVISVGDFNLTGDSSEQTYQTLRTAFHDPANPAGNWTSSASFTNLLSESATAVRFRDDIQFVNANTDAGSGANGLQLIAGTEGVFGNSGVSGLYGKAVTLTANNGAFSGIDSTQATAIFNALTVATDHLPTLADYSVVGLPTPEPVASLLLIAGVSFGSVRRRHLPAVVDAES